MQELIEYIRDTARVRYVEWHPHNEVIRLMYGMIAGAVRKQAETLTVTRDHVLFGKAGVQKVLDHIGWQERTCTRRWEGRKSRDNTCFRDALALIVEHDEGVRKHLELVEETPERITCRFVFGNKEE